MEPIDYESAASYRACRVQGRAVRKLVDCLIGAVAIRYGVAVLQVDTDFDALAAATKLKLDPLSGN